MGTNGLGQRRAFAVVPILRGTVYAVGSWDAEAVLAEPIGRRVPPWVFPILMWAACLLVAYVAVHRLVIRHVAELRRQMREFADHRRLPGGALRPGAPAELAEMAGGFAAMAERILREDAETEDRLHEQKVLLREVHHRVKNNLQLISSIINMQIAPESTRWRRATCCAGCRTGCWAWRPSTATSPRPAPAPSARTSCCARSWTSSP